MATRHNCTHSNPKKSDWRKGLDKSVLAIADQSAEEKHIKKVLA